MKYYLSLILCVALLVPLFFQSVSLAGEEVYPDRAAQLKVTKHSLKNVILGNSSENIMTIDGKEYIFNDHTKFSKEDANSEGINVSKITLPCLVDITYKTFSVYTEGMPYDTDDKLLIDVLVKKDGKHQRKDK